MSDELFILRGNRVLTPEGIQPGAIHIKGGKIMAVAPVDVTSPGVPVIDAGDFLITPGIVDSHVHINEPGRTEWEGFDTASAAAAAGGITTVVDMPLNCIPATTSRAAAEQKLLALQGKIHVNVAFWGGVVPGNVSELEGLAKFGVPGAKCFTCPSGVDEFPHVTREDLELALPKLRDLGLTLLVHAEAPGPLDQAEKDIQGADPSDYQTYLRSRPRKAEDDAISMVIDLCKKHKARAHIVHLASGSAVPLLEAAQKAGVQISAETCLHYLTFASEEIPARATHYKCAPPIRDAANREELWKGLERGVIAMVVSDHSPCTPALKKSDTGDFMGAWGGISGLQFGLSALWTLCKERGHSVEQMFKWNAEAPAKLAGLDKRKARIASGFDADLVVWDDKARVQINVAENRHRHKVTPYEGKTLYGAVRKTFVGGKLSYDEKTGLSKQPAGSFVAVRR